MSEARIVFSAINYAECCWRVEVSVRQAELDGL